MVHCLMEMKMTNLQRENQIRFAEISLQQLKVVFSSLYGHHVRVYKPVNIGKTMDGFVRCNLGPNTWHRAPVVNLSILVFNGKFQSDSNVLGSEHRAH